MEKPLALQTMSDEVRQRDLQTALESLGNSRSIILLKAAFKSDLKTIQGEYELGAHLNNIFLMTPEIFIKELFYFLSLLMMLLQS